MMYFAINIFTLHVFIIAPLLIYIGLIRPKYDWLYYILFALGLGVIVNFGLKVIGQPWTQRTVWYAIHIMLFAILLLYVGWFGVGASDVSFSLLLTVGVAALGYHTIRYIQRKIYQNGKK